MDLLSCMDIPDGYIPVLRQDGVDGLIVCDRPSPVLFSFGTPTLRVLGGYFPESALGFLLCLGLAVGRRFSFALDCDSRLSRQSE